LAFIFERRMEMDTVWNGGFTFRLSAQQRQNLKVIAEQNGVAESEVLQNAIAKDLTRKISTIGMAEMYPDRSCFYSNKEDDEL
jgi:hypothetical protein